MSETPTPPAPTRPFAACAVSGHLDTRTAGMEIAEQLEQGIVGRCDLVVLLASFHHIAAFREAATTIRQTINPQTMLGATAESVLGREREMEGLAGMSAIALQLPGVKLQPWISTPQAPIPISKPEQIPQRLGLTEDFQAAIILADPFSTPIARLLPAVSGCRGPERPVRLIGGMASGSSQPGQNVLMVDEEYIAAGAVGVSVAGEVEVDCVVSQGCRPIGQPMVVTKAQQNVIQELGGHKALAALQGMAGELEVQEQEMLQRGLLVGTVINEYKEHFGRGDFLIRNVLGVDREAESIIIGDIPHVGRTIQFHVRDAETASEDLQLLLDAQQLKSRPVGALLFTCNGRGQRLFEESNHDIDTIRQRLRNVPIAGFFAAGEIGPIGDQSFLHGNTAALALFRTAEPES